MSSIPPKQYLPEKTLHELFAEQAGRTPEAVAVRFENQSLTYSELNRQANRLAHCLRGLGAGPEVLVGLYVERSLELVVGLLAIQKAGAAYLPIDPAYPARRITFMLEDAHAPVVLTQARMAASLPESGARILCIDNIEEMLEAAPDTNPPSSSGPDNLAYVIFTSGSTGMPKGTLITHYNVVRLMQATAHWYGFNEHDVWTLFHSHAFDFSVWELWGALLYGGRVVVVPFDVSRSPKEFYHLLVSEGVTVLNQTPTAFLQLMQAEEELGVSRGLALRFVIFGGEALDLHSLQPWFERHGDAIPRLVNMYGITETTVHVTYRPLSITDVNRHSVIGEPIRDLQLHILDENRLPAVFGSVGEIYVGGAGVARGYLNRPELTAERFLSDPFTDAIGAKLYRSGDLARRLPDGDIEYVGRRDNQVKVRGFRIELGEIEARLGRHPTIRAAAVVARQVGPGDARLLAYVVSRGRLKVDSSVLREHLRQTLPDYMIPARFTTLESLPLTPHGKIDHQALLDRHDVELPPDDSIAAPRNGLEEQLIAIWREVLYLPAISTRNRFDDLGGNSLLSMKIAARVRKAFGIDLPAAMFLGATTIADLAAAVTSALTELRHSTFPPVRRVPRDGNIPASFPQERVRFLQTLYPDCVAYQFVGLLWISGQLNIKALEQSLTALVRRHEIYRTTFALAEGGTVQHIHEPFPVALMRVDLRYLPATERRSAAESVAHDESEHLFDPERLPLVRWTLVELGDGEYALIQAETHLVHDGWSFNVLLTELKSLYDAFSSGREPNLPELEFQFADFAAWQRDWSKGDEARRQLEYWRNRLAGSDREIRLPIDRPRPPVLTFRGRVLQMRLPAELTCEVIAFSRRENGSVFMTTLTAFATLLHLYSGETDLNIGSGIANRRLREFENILGMFVNTVVLRQDLTGNPSFREFLGRVRSSCLEAYANQDVPFEKVVDMLQPRRSLGRQPFFQVMFSFHDSVLNDFELAGTRTTVHLGITRGAKADLNVIFVPQIDRRCNRSASVAVDEINMMWEFNTDLFDEPTVRRMAQQYLQLLACAVRDPDRRVSELPLLTPAERYQLLVKWNNTEVDYPRNHCIHHLFERQVKRTPEAPAVVCGDAPLSYRELDARANQLAHHLRTLGVGPEVLVGICLERSLELVIGLLGILKAGGAYVPLDPSYPAQRLAFMLEDTQAPVLLTQERLLGQLPSHAGCTLCLDRDWPTVAVQPATNPPETASAANLAYVIYTSGSTGQPKGVAVSHRSVARLVFGVDYVRFGAEETFLLLAPMVFDASTFELWGALLHGSRCVIYPEGVPTARGLEDVITHHGVTTMWLTAALFNAIIDERPAALLGVRQLLTGGEALSVRHVRSAQAVLPDTQLVNGYGPTESTTFTCCYRITHTLPADCLSVPIGRPIGNTAVYVLDARQAPVPIGVPGELYIGGDGLARGYWRRPELTAERFVPDPFSKRADARLYRSGDRVRYRPDGNLEFLGRLDNQIKLRGFRIELGEIEAVLAQQPQVREAVVVLREDTPGDPRLVAYVLARGDTIAADLRAFARQLLPEYMLPAAFVLLPALPLTPNGKVDRSALPAPTYESSEPEYGPPRTPMERALADVMAKVLNVGRVGINDNFFDLGGHSLLALRLMNRIRHDLNIDLSLRQLFETPTVSGLALAASDNIAQYATDRPLSPRA